MTNDNGPKAISLDGVYAPGNFSSYEDFVKNFKINVPENFNFGFDIVDEMAKKAPAQNAIVWCDDSGAEAVFNFKQVSEQSNRAANALKALGIKKGDVVMLVLKRRYEFWFICTALHKIGAACIPATHLLTVKDVVYRAKAANIKMIITVADGAVMDCVDAAQKDSPSLTIKASIGNDRPGWANICSEMEKASPDLARPKGHEGTKNSDIFLLYFTSGTTGMPKMVRHNFTYPWGISLRPNTGRTSGSAGYISPWLTRAGQRRPGERSTASGYAAARSWYLITTGLTRKGCLT